MRKPELHSTLNVSKDAGRSWSRIAERGSAQ